MNIIDTHTHIYSKEFDADRTEVIQRAKEAGVRAVLLPNEDSGSIEIIDRLSCDYPDFAFPMIGLHPTSVDDGYISEIGKIEASLLKRRYYAIGEIGIDLYWDKSRLKEQKTVFEEQLRWSIDMQLPVVIHSRDSFDEVLDSIYNVGAERLKGVFHCFGGTPDEWTKIAKLSNFAVGIGGVVTYKNNVAIETLGQIPLERVVLETDAPYLSPVPYRGKRNEPKYIVEVAKKLAEKYEIPIKDVANQTFQNALKLFDVSLKMQY
ncbi:MAG: TatD family hydrolase [Tannerella sp.]|jgi:TatD DNase family protein|nr:TatD family hydrolase [Tannerella sp.]